MNKKALILSLILVFAGVSLALAGPPPFSPWKCLVYDGLVFNDIETQTVTEDTAVFVTNPNSVPVNAWIRIFNKDGGEIYQGWLLDHFEELKEIPTMGFAWIPLGWALNSVKYQTEGREKLTFLIYMSKPRVTKPEPGLKCVVEEKQVIYRTNVHPFDLLTRMPGDTIAEVTETAVEHWTKCATVP